MILCWLLVLMCSWGVCRGRINLVLKKPVISSDSNYYEANSNDNDKTTCMWIKAGPLVMVAFDLEKEYKIDEIEIHNGKNRGTKSINVLVGNVDFCDLEHQMSQLKQCDEPQAQKSEKTVFKCKGLVGQKIVIVRGSYNGKTNEPTFRFCEVEAFGQNVSRQSLEFDNKSVSNIQRSYFRHLNALRNNYPTAVVKYQQLAFLRLNKDCEPFIFEQIAGRAFAMACSSKDAKTKALFFGAEWYFYYSKGKFRQDLIKWLSPNTKNPTIHHLYNLKAFKDLKPKQGDIISYDKCKVCKPKDIDQLLKWHDDGFIGLTVGESFSNRPDYDYPIVKILDHFNVNYDERYFRYSGPTEFTAKDTDFKEMLVDPEDIIDKMLLNHKYMQDNAESFSTVLRYLKPEFDKNVPSFGVKAYKLIKKYLPYLRKICPCNIYPNKYQEQHIFMNLMVSLAMRPGVAKYKTKLPCIAHFPGDFHSSPKSIKQTIKIHGDIKKTKNPTGLYIRAGQIINYKVVNKTGTWSFEIGCQTDKLIRWKSKIYRYPYIYSDNIMVADVGTMHSPIGGVLWIINQKKNSDLTIEINNVVQAPFFNLHNKQQSINNWDQYMRQNAEGLWGQVAGQDFTSCGKSEELKKFSGIDIANVLEIWDKVVRNNYVFSSEKWRSQRPEIAMLDIQPKHGSAHNGYPMVFSSDYHQYMYNYSFIIKGNAWGVIHELGHNRQKKIWTYHAIQETTNNIYILYNYAKVFKKPYYGQTKELFKGRIDINKLKAFLDKRAPYSIWAKKHAISLPLYIQLINNFGFGMWYDTLKYYEEHKNKKEMYWIRTKYDKRDAWINVTSTVIGMNLVPLYRFWGWRVSKRWEKLISNNFKYCFLPNDYFMDLSSKRKSYILSKYPKCKRKSSYYKDFNAGNLIVGNRPNFFTKIQ